MKITATHNQKSIRSAVRVLFLGLGFFVVFTLHTANAQSATINYQGKLADSTGAAVADGSYNIRFWLLQNTGQATTSAVWTEELTGADQVSVVNGLFSVMLGSTTALSGVDFNQTLYLGVEVGGTGSPTWDGEMLPRKPLGTVPAAFSAAEADNTQTFAGIATTSFLRSDTADSMDAFLALTAGGSATDFEVTGTATTTNLVVGTDFISDLTGAGLTITGNALTVSSSSLNLTLDGLGDTNLSSPADGDLFSYNGSEWVNVATSSLGFVDTGATDFLSLTDTPGSFNADRILFQSGSAVIDDADFAFAPSTNTLTLGGMTISDILTTHTGASTTTIPSNNPYAWTISTGVGVPPLFRIDTTTGQEFVNIGNGTGDVLIGDIGSGADLVFEESSTISGQGENTITLGEAGDTFNVAASFFGIGTSSPSQPFTITTNTLLTGALLDRNYTAGTNGMVMQTTGTGVEWVATSTLGFVDTGATDFLSLTDTPGSFTANRLLFQTGSAVTDSADLTFDGGNLDLAGTNTGLAFQGVRMFYASTTNDSIAIGENAGANFNAGTTFNVALGFEAGRNASSTGSDFNSFIGYLAGENNTGDENNIFGYLAGRNNTGDDNNLIGKLAGRDNSGFDNNIIGDFAGYLNEGGHNNLIGDSSGFRNTGDDNNIFGRTAGYDNTGNENNIFGWNSGYANTGLGNQLIGSFSGRNNSGDYVNALGIAAGFNNTGSFVNLIGENAGRSNSGSFSEFIGYRAAVIMSASNTVAIGRESLRGGSGDPFGGNAATTTDNTVVGAYAGFGAQTGADNNILIGYRAADSLTTGANNLIIGYDVEAPSNTADNQLNIGNLIFGTGVDGTGTTLSSGNIGIGTSSPSSKLSVWGDFRVGTGSVPTLFADTSANWVGIGTTSRSITGTTTERLTIAGGGVIANSPTDPQVVGGVDTTVFAYNVTIAGGYAYVTDFTNGLEIIDISDPTNPVIVGGVDTVSFARGLTVAGRYAYVADGDNGLEIIDISDPTNPSIVGGVDTLGLAYDVTIAGRYAYVADGSNGLEIIDISDPTNPSIVGGVDTIGIPFNLTVAGRYAYVADGSNGLEIIDISDPTNPSIVGGVDTIGSAFSLTISDRYAYVADNSNGLEIIDISDPTNPVIVGGVDTVGFARGLTVAGRYAYVADGTNGLEIIDISDPTNPSIIGGVDTVDDTYDVTIAGRYAFVTDGANGLTVVDIGGSEFSSLFAGALGATQANIDQDLIVGQNTLINSNLNVGNDARIGGLLSIQGYSSSTDTVNQALLSLGGASTRNSFMSFLGGVSSTTQNVWSAGLNQADGSFRIASSSGLATNSYFTIGAGGNVGIGTTSPYAKLSINGDLALTGGIYDNTASLGIAGMVMQTTGSGVQWVDPSSFATPIPVAVFTSTSNAYDISVAADPVVALTVGGIQNNPRAILFNDDGTTLYLIGFTGTDIDAYTLSTPFDISTGISAGLALDVGTQESFPTAMLFNGDGTILYVMGFNDDDINAYPLDIPYDISSYTSGTSIVLDVSGQENLPVDMLFNDDGTVFYVVGSDGDDINAYPLDTPYDISSYTSGTSIVLDVSGQDIEPASLLFSDDGAILYVLGIDGDDINAYPLPIPYDIDSYTSGTSIVLDVFLQEANGADMIFNNDGSSLYILGRSGQDITEYSIAVDTAITPVISGSSLAIGTTTPQSKLSLENLVLDGAGISGLSQYLTTTNSVDAALQFGNYFNLSASNTATTTLVGSSYLLTDNTTFGNTVRGLEVQADLGANTQGENTALSGFARTFGVRGFTSGDAGGSFEPAGGFFETGGSDQGNAIRGFSSSITSASLLSLFQDTSDFTGTGLQMNFGNTTGDFSSSTSKYLDFQNAGTSVFTVSAFGTTTIGDGTTNNMAGLQIGFGGICVDNDGTCTASTTGRITSVESQTGNSDLAEMYFSADDLESGQIVSLVGELSIERAIPGANAPILGVVSTKPGLTLGFDDVSTRAGESGFPIALSGRVPVQLSTENGDVKAGDELMLSTLPGIAMKSDGTGTVVGIALEDFDEDRLYSDTFINQFGDDVAEPVFEPIITNSDPRINDGCYFGGGGTADAEPCVPLSTDTEFEQLLEANELAEADSVLEAIEDLKYEDSETVTLNSGDDVQVGQIVMFVDRVQPELNQGQRDVLAALMGTTTLAVQVDEEEPETLMERLISLADGFVDGVFKAIGIEVEFVKTDEVQSETLCLGSTCIDEAELRSLLEQRATTTTTVSEETEDVEGGTESTEETDNSGGTTQPPVTTTGTTTSSTTDQTAEPVIDTATSSPDTVAEPIADTETEVSTETTPEPTTVEEVVEADIPEEEISSEPEIIADPEPVPELVEEEIVPEVPEV